MPNGVSGFDAKQLAGIDSATEVRGSDKRFPSGGTPDLIAGRRKAQPDFTRVKSSKHQRQRRDKASDSVKI